MEHIQENLVHKFYEWINAVCRLDVGSDLGARYLLIDHHYR